jgi:hypothetical protein
MAGLPSWRAVATLALVFYLCAAGWFFVLVPWSRLWGLVVVPRAPIWLLPWLDNPAVRGALSGFGVLHFLVAFSWLAGETRKA